MRAVNYNIQSVVSVGSKDDIDTFYDNKSYLPGSGDEEAKIAQLKEKTDKVYPVSFPAHPSFNALVVLEDDGRVFVCLKNSDLEQSNGKRFLGQTPGMIRNIVHTNPLFSPPIEIQLMYTASCKVFDLLKEEALQDKTQQNDLSA